MATNRSVRWLTVLRFAPIISQLLVDVLDEIRKNENLVKKDSQSPDSPLGASGIPLDIDAVLSRTDVTLERYQGVLLPSGKSDVGA